MLRVWTMLAVSSAACRFGFAEVPGTGDALLDTPTPLPAATFDFDFRQDPLGNLTITRASNATYVDAMGVIRTAAPDQLRVDHDPMTGAPRGLLIEASRTNLLTHSTDLAQAPDRFSTGNMTVISNVATSPEGTQTADEVVDAAATDARRGHGVAIPNDAQPYTFSVFARPNTITRFSFGAELLGGVTIQTTMTIDLMAPTITSPPPRAAGYGIEPYPDGWVCGTSLVRDRGRTARSTAGARSSNRDGA